jgi:hypothetical protein
MSLLRQIVHSLSLAVKQRLLQNTQRVVSLIVAEGPQHHQANDSQPNSNLVAEFQLIPNPVRPFGSAVRAIIDSNTGV